MPASAFAICMQFSKLAKKAAKQVFGYLLHMMAHFGHCGADVIKVKLFPLTPVCDNNMTVTLNLFPMGGHHQTVS
jgi:hypothetical protein